MTLPTQKPKRTRLFIMVPLLLVGAGWLIAHVAAFASARAQSANVPPAPPPKPPFAISPDWPSDTAEAAVGIQGYGVLGTSGKQHPHPTASIAKVITALAVLEKHPLKPGDEGPLIPITEQDEQRYRDYVARNGTVVLVQTGTPITYRQALEGMLLPSANNIADTTAVWAFGSLKAYSRYANAMVKRLGLPNTTVGVDASGLDPSTKSTASDLVKLGEAALKNPVIAQIAAMPSGSINYAGWIPNYNGMVTKHGYTGIKPGESVQAGNNLLFSTNQTINGKVYAIVGAVMGTPGYTESNSDTMQIVNSLVANALPRH